MLRFVGSHEIADGLAQIQQLSVDKLELENSLRASHEAHKKLCQENSDLTSELDATRLEYTTATNQLDVCSISKILFFYPFDQTFAIKAYMKYVT